MNRSRVLVLGLAALAAGAAALLARGLLGGGTEKSHAALPVAPQIVTSEVLVAANDIPPGTAMTAAAVRWQAWPTKSIDSSFMTKSENPDLDKAVTGTVARTPLVAGEPLTMQKIVRSEGAGFMAAMLTPGMRAVSINITTETGAGGFILPNDRVDVLLTTQISDTPRRFATATILPAVRVLAIDQNAGGDAGQKVVAGAKSATLELTPGQAEQVERAQATGLLSLALRALGDDAKAGAALPSNANSSDGEVAVIRYGVTRPGQSGRKD
jgi:pilus assembly protein CpaB